MPILNTDDLINAFANSQHLMINKASSTSEGAGTWQSLWKAAGDPPAGSNPPAFSSGSGYVPTKATTGAIPYTNPTNGNTLHCLNSEVALAQIGQPTLLDRLWHCSGFACNSTSAQNINTFGTLPSGRNPADKSIEIWGEFYTAPGATASVFTLTGTDLNGNTGRTWTYSKPANAETVGQMVQFIPGGGNPATTRGCQSLDSLQLSASTGSAGDFGVTIVRRINTWVNRQANVSELKDAYQMALARIFDDSCLSVMVYCSTTSTGLLNGAITVGQA